MKHNPTLAYYFPMVQRIQTRWKQNWYSICVSIPHYSLGVAKKI